MSMPIGRNSMVMGIVIPPQEWYFVRKTNSTCSAVGLAIASAIENTLDGINIE